MLRDNPALAAKALSVLSRWESVADTRSTRLRETWREIILQRRWDEAVEESERGNQLRQASPLGFVLPVQTRDDIMKRFTSARYSEHHR